MKLKNKQFKIKTSSIRGKRIRISANNDVRVINNSFTSTIKAFSTNYNPITNVTPPELTRSNVADLIVRNYASYSLNPEDEITEWEWGDAAGSVNPNSPPSTPSTPSAPAVVRITKDFPIARFQIPQFKLGTCRLNIPIRLGPYSWTFTIPGISGRFLGRRYSIGPWRRTVRVGAFRRNIGVNYPCIQYRQSIQEFYITVTYPNIQNGIDVNQIVNETLEKSKDAAVQQLLLYLPFATVSGGASLAAAFTQALHAFKDAFIQNLKNFSNSAAVAINGYGIKTASAGPYKRLVAL